MPRPVHFEIQAADPAVRAGSLIIEAHPWFGLPGDTLPPAPTPE